MSYDQAVITPKVGKSIQSIRKEPLDMYLELINKGMVTDQSGKIISVPLRELEEAVLAKYDAFIYKKCSYYHKHLKLKKLRLEVSDLYQESFYGFREALQSYKPKKGKFITHLGVHIRKCIQTTIRNSRFIKGKIKTTSLEKMFTNTEGNYEVNLSDNAAIAEEMIITEETKSIKKRRIKELMVGLTPKENIIITGIFFDDKYQNEIADELGVSINAISSCKKRGLKKIKEGIKGIHYNDYEITDLVYSN